MSNVIFRTYRQYPAVTRKELRARAAKMRLRLANLLTADDPDRDELVVALRDAWLLCGAIARAQPKPRRQNFSDEAIRASARHAAAESSSADAAYGKTVEILLAERGVSAHLSITALKKRLLRIGRFECES